MSDHLQMCPVPGERLVRFVGDTVRFELRCAKPPAGARALLRTNLGNAKILRQEIISSYSGKRPLSVAFWRDIPMKRDSDEVWSLELPLTEVGFFKAKAYLVDHQRGQTWPEGPDAGISVHPDLGRSGNTIYCAFTRMFGPTMKLKRTYDEAREQEMGKWDKEGYTVIPPSGKFHDLQKQIPHIVETLGCKILHLLPVNPTPTTFARFGRFGSPYAAQDLTAVDPALVEFDKQTTGIEQFQELCYTTHAHGARVFLDMVINHTGWGSTLYEEHPEWFSRKPDGEFMSPGAWGTVWEDLVELHPEEHELWEELAKAFLTWSRRGVDGFRCDAGYKVPLPVWQYIVARVREEFPNTIFLLEGLGGSWEATELLLTEGGMQWAYSELFQNYSGEQVQTYLDYALKQSERVGLYIHYSETHDNTRLAAQGKNWSLLRNKLCALTSVSGGFGFTCGVEWLAEEKVNVHSSRGLAWGSKDNLVKELSALNRLLLDHPCFLDHAKIERLSPPGSVVFCARRTSADGNAQVLLLINTDAENSATYHLKKTDWKPDPRLTELTGQELPALAEREQEYVIRLPAGAAFCLGEEKRVGAKYRKARAQAAWALECLSASFLPEQLGAFDWQELANLVHRNSVEFLGKVSNLTQAAPNLIDALNDVDDYPRVISWKRDDCRKVTVVPPDHWLILVDSARFRAQLDMGGIYKWRESIETSQGHIAAFPPEAVRQSSIAALRIESYGQGENNCSGSVKFLPERPVLRHWLEESGFEPPNKTLLLTNGRGAMCRMAADLGAIFSKYDCALGANLHPDLPVDRHIFVKRVRAWINADGFITPLNWEQLKIVTPGPPATWQFVANTGNARFLPVEIKADMLEERNSTVLRISRPVQPQTETFDVRFTLRVDIEDRNFHSETHRNGGAEFHFHSNTATLADRPGFRFAPAPDRQLQVFTTRGVYYPGVEWSFTYHPIEKTRGQVDHGDAFSPGWFEIQLQPGEHVYLVLSADPLAPPNTIVEHFEEDRAALNQLVTKRATLDASDIFGARLAQSATAFLVRRGSGKTVIAGYPWFLDWGRDTLISARGLLSAGFTSEVSDLLLTFGRFVENGTMPNTIHGADSSNRDTSDAPLWYGVVCEELAQLSGPDIYDYRVDSRGRKVRDVLSEIARGYLAGTPNGIKVDESSGLVWSPKHFTWMDTNYPAGTPREGYPIEIQALWIRLLRQLHALGDTTNQWKELADKAQKNFDLFFWLEDAGYYSDCLIAPAGQPARSSAPDNALRSNSVFAISLGLTTGEKARRCLNAIIQHLVVPGGLRSLAPLPVSPPLPVYGANGELLNDPVFPYFGTYEGDEDTRRKPSYHNGTAWTWTFPSFCEALAATYNFHPNAVAAAKSYLLTSYDLLFESCLGHIPEVLDGDAPHHWRGCDAQAWSVTEALRVWKLLNYSNFPKK